MRETKLGLDVAKKMEKARQRGESLEPQEWFFLVLVVFWPPWCLPSLLTLDLASGFLPRNNA